MPILPKLIYRFKATPIKIPARFFGKYKQDYSKMYTKGKETRRAKKILKKNQVRGIILPNFRTDCIATVIKTMCYWWSDSKKSVEQRT